MEKSEKHRLSVPFAVPDCRNGEIEEIEKVIKSGWLTTASRCAIFESEFAEFVGARHAIAVNSATSALHLGLEALGINEGDRVLVPTFTFTATAEVVRYLKADPIFVDCDPETFCIDATHIDNALKIQGSGAVVRDVKAIVPVHFGGHPCDMDGILQLAETMELRVVEDAAHAFPTRYSSKQSALGSKQHLQRIVGAIGDVTCFSFYATKTITTGEGGMLCTDDDGIAKRVKVMRLHGIDRDVWDRYSVGGSWEYDVIAPGYKYNLPDICAAMGIHQLRKAEDFRKKRQRIAQVYYEELKEVPGLILPRIQCAMEDHSWYLFNTLVDPDETKRGTERNQFIEEMTKHGIGTSVHYKPLHRMTYYKEKYGLKPEMFPNAEWVFRRCVCLPIFSAMTDGQVEHVISGVKKILL